MKKFTTLIMTGLATLLTACSTTYSSYSGYDDVYYSRNHEATATPVVRPAPASENVAVPDYTTAVQQEAGQYTGENSYADNPAYQAYSPDYQTNTYTTPEGDVYNTNYYYGGEFQFNDYHDYAYSSRIRRFGRPHFNDYYHDYYTNNYWYSYDPWYYGTSIYLGYNFWYPSHFYGRPRWHVGFGWGWGWPYTSWYSPYSYYYGWGWPSYSMGYWHGYWDGYYGGYYGDYYRYYHNSYDYNAYYGPRTPRTSTSGTSSSGREPRSLGERYELAMANQGVTTGYAARMARVAEPDRRSATEVRPDDKRAVAGEPQRSSEGTTDLQRRTTTQTAESSTPATRVIGSGEVSRDATPAVRSTSESQSPATRQVGETRTAPPSQEATRAVTTPERSPQSRPDPSGQVSPGEGQRTPSAADRYSNTSRYNYERYAPDSRTRESYQRPDPAAYQRYEKPKVYTAPGQTRPQSGQEYTSPRAKDPASFTRPGSPESPARQTEPTRTAPQPGVEQSRPVQQGTRQYTPPARPATREVTTPSQRTAPTYTPPARQDNRPMQTPSRSGNYAPPTRSSSPPANYSPPTRSSGSSGSSGSYSPPARSSSSSSSGSVSTPSRSSSSSSSSSSGSSRSSGSSSSSNSGRGSR